MRWKEYYVIGKLTAQKMKCFIKIFLSEYGQIRSFVQKVMKYDQICSLLKKFLMENVTFSAVLVLFIVKNCFAKYHK